MSATKLGAAILAMGIFAAAAPRLAAAQGAADSAVLHERVKAYQSTWNTHGPAAIAAFFSEDADMAFGNLPAIRGREAIEAWWRTYFERQEPERGLTLEVNSVRFVTADVAVMNVATTNGGEIARVRSCLRGDLAGPGCCVARVASAHRGDADARPHNNGDAGRQRPRPLKTAELRL